MKMMGVIADQPTPKITEEEICFTATSSDSHHRGGMVIIYESNNSGTPSARLQGENADRRNLPGVNESDGNRGGNVPLVMIDEEEDSMGDVRRNVDPFRNGGAGRFAEEKTPTLLTNDSGDNMISVVIDDFEDDEDPDREEIF